MSQNMLGVALHDARGPLTTLMERLSGQEGALWLRRLNKFNRGENPFEIPRFFEVTSDGRTSGLVIIDLAANRCNVDDCAEQLLRSGKFVATNGKTYKLGVIMGSEFEDSDRTNQNIWVEGERRRWQKPTMEHAALLRELVSNEEIEHMGLRALIVMHVPVTDSDGDPNLLGLHRYGEGRWLIVYNGDPGYRWDRGYGFVFLLPQV